MGDIFSSLSQSSTPRLDLYALFCFPLAARELLPIHVAAHQILHVTSGHVTDVYFGGIFVKIKTNIKVYKYIFLYLILCSIKVYFFK